MGRVRADRKGKTGDPLPRDRRDGKWRRWVRLGGRVLALTVVALVLGHWYWGYSCQRELLEQVHAYGALGEAIEPRDLKDATVSEGENGVVELRNALSELHDSAAEWVTFAQLDLGPPLSSGQMEVVNAVMRSNRAALGHLDLALARRGADWGMAFEMPLLRTRAEGLEQALHLATLLRAAALYAHQDAMEGEALRRVRQILGMARLIDRQRSISAHIAATAMTALAAKTAGELAPDLKVSAPIAGPLAGLIGEFLDDRPMQEAQRRALELVRATYWDTAIAVAGGRDDLLVRNGAPVISGGRLGCYLRKPLLVKDGLWLVRYMTTIMDATKHSADWPTLYRGVMADQRVMMAEPERHPLAMALIFDVEGFVRGQYRALTECRLAGMALGAAWFARDHGGAMPASLAELKTRYVPFVPFDPMAAGGKPLGMNSAGERCVIYSVGDDGIDDGGNEVAVGARGGAGRWERRDFVVQLKGKRQAPVAATRGN
jgi:hypothetical protein